jgi:predicted esterase
MLVLCFQLLPQVPCAAQPYAFPLGEIVEQVVSPSDPTQSYGIYLPASYRPDSAWPLAFLMDPRGRALVPLQPLQEVAERLGYILMSSYDTRSDGPPEPNERAVQAMVADAQELFSVDVRRLYLVGFSGTARVAWGFGYRMAGNVAGIIGFGGGLPSPLFLRMTARTEGTPFVFFGGAGTTDFNYEEMWELDDTLDAYDMPHRFEYFDGPHTWPPSNVFASALEWMDLQAAKAGLRAADSMLIESVFSRRLTEARAREASGELYEAFLRYRAILEDYSGIRDVTEPQEKVTQLAASEDVRRTERRLREILERRRAYNDRLRSFGDEIRTSLRAPRLSEAVRHLEIDRLKRRAASIEDPMDALAAQRLLEEVFVRTSFYEPRHFLEQGEPEVAIALLLIAQEIRPRHPQVCYYLARGYAQAGQHDEAFEALGCFLQTSAVDVSRIEADSLLAPLRADPRYRELLDAIRPSVPQR